MIQSIAYCIYFIISIKSSICLQFNLQSNTFSFDFTLNSVSLLYEKIPFQVPSVKLCFGTPNTQCFNMVLSTTLIHTIVEITESEQKHFTNQFNHSLSSTFDEKTFKSGMGFPLFDIRDYYFVGKVSLDVIGFPNMPSFQAKYGFAACKSRHKFPLFPIDGYLAMSKHQYAFEPYMSLITYLYNNGVIDRPAFTLNYNSQGGGTVTFGENATDYYMCHSSDDRRSIIEWDCNVTMIEIGTLKLGKMVENNIILFNSVTSAVIAPYHIGLEIMHYVIKTLDNKCKTSDSLGNVILICDENTKIKKIPPLHIKINNTELMIEWKYLLKLTEIDNTMSYISLFIADRQYNNYQWTIGMPGFIDHSIYFDKSTMTIGIKYMSTSMEDRIKQNIQIVLVILTLILCPGVILLCLLKKGNIFNTRN